MLVNLTPQVNLLAERAHEMRGGGKRLMIALCGAPASGKSTLASELARRLNDQKCLTRVVPMDGFHLDNAVLSEWGELARKGAPHTFDAAGFVTMIQRLAKGEEVAIPVFDRTRDIAIAGAEIVPEDAEVVIVEGNYLLFDRAPWSDLAQYWSLSVRLDVPIPELRARLIHRWLSLGYSRTVATRRAEANDIPNAEVVMQNLLPADITLSPEGAVV